MEASGVLQTLEPQAVEESCQGVKGRGVSRTGLSDPDREDSAKQFKLAAIDGNGRLSDQSDLVPVARRNYHVCFSRLVD